MFILRSSSLSILASIAFFELALSCSGQDLTAAVHSSTEVPSGSRYELVQSPLAARLMLRVDRFTGDVDQLVLDTKGNGYFWTQIKLERGAQKGFHIYSDSRVHFQVFSSGIAVRDTFLIDVDTGNTWILVKDKEDQQFWESVD